MSEEVLRVWECVRCGGEAYAPEGCDVFCHRCEEAVMVDTGQKVVLDDDNNVVIVN